MTANVIIVTLGALFFACAYLFGPKKTILTAYYALKYALFKPVEWLLRLFIAIIRIKGYIGAGWAVSVLLTMSVLPEQNVRLFFFLLTLFLSWLVVMQAIRNFRDEDDRDDVRMLLAQLEHKLCFKNQKLSMYPDDWHWLD